MHKPGQQIGSAHVVQNIFKLKENVGKIGGYHLAFQAGRTSNRIVVLDILRLNMHISPPQKSMLSVSFINQFDCLLTPPFADHVST